jgi:GAF domain-containing protein
MEVELVEQMQATSDQIAQPIENVRLYAKLAAFIHFRADNFFGCRSGGPH